MKGYQLTLVVTGSVFTFLSCFVIFLRILVLQIRGRQKGWDDRAMFIAFAFSIGFAISSFISVRWGVGTNLESPPLSWEVNAIKVAYIVEFFYVLTIFSIKMSLLLLYLRIATDRESIFYKGTITMIVLICLNLIPLLVVSAAQCVPVSKYWDPQEPGRCVNITATFYANAGFTIITDCVMLALPMPTLWRIQRPRAQRLGLLAVFLVGGLSTIASCVRLYSIRIYTKSDNPLRDVAPLDIWSFIEINLGILCASVPALKPLFIRGSKLKTVINHCLPYHRTRSTEKKTNLIRINETTTYASLFSKCFTKATRHRGHDERRPRPYISRPMTAHCRDRFDHGQPFHSTNTYDAHARVGANPSDQQSFGSHEIKITTKVDVESANMHGGYSLQRYPRANVWQAGFEKALPSFPGKHF